MVTMLVSTACTAKKVENPPQPKAEVKKGPNGEVYGGTYHIAINSEPPVIDPQVDTTLQVYNLSRNIFNTLIRYKGNSLELEPELLAEMPKTEADNVTYHFKLRNDVKFTNGTPLMAKDVKYTVERMLNPTTKAQNTWVYEEIKGAQDVIDKKATELAGFKITGDYTFDLILERPFGPFLSNLATPPASIYPADYAKQQGDQFGRKPIGSGPFKVADWKANELLALDKNADYFEKGFPFLDKVEYKVIKEEATRWLEFAKGNTDEESIPTAEFDAVAKGQTGVLLKYVALNTYYLALNQDVVKDKRVRQAISMAIDRKKILSVVRHDQGVVAKSFVTPGIPGALTNAAGFEYNPEKAKQLLKDAGATGLKIEAWQRGGDKVVDDSLAIQQMLKDIGIDWTVKIVDKATFNDARSKGNVPSNFGNWWADYPDPDNYLYTYFQSKSSKSMSVNYNNADADKILADARGLADQSKRQKMYQDLETKLLYDEYALIPLFHLYEYYAAQKGVHGNLANPTGVGGLKTVWKDAK